jgi:hypothetical protein
LAHIVDQIRLLYQDLLPATVEFHWLPGTRIRLNGQTGMIVRISANRCCVQLEGNRGPGSYSWETILRVRKEDGDSIEL